MHPPAIRELVYQKNAEGLSYAVIGVQLNLSKSTVQNIIHPKPQKPGARQGRPPKIQKGRNSYSESNRSD